MKSKSGFTLIEVSLFLALSAVLFMMVVAGVQNSIYQQRRNDAVQSFADFLKNAYSEVTNVQGLSSGGKSEKAIYGKMITFGEDCDLTQNSNDGSRNFFMYSVVGKAKIDGINKAIEGLEKAEADVLIKDDNGSVKYAGLTDSYTMKWSGSLSKIIVNGKEINSDFPKAALLIVRNPTSGSVNTFVNKDGVDVNERIEKSYERMSWKRFESADVDFCIDYDSRNNDLVDVRVANDSQNSAGVSIHYDDDDNRCNN